MTNKYNYLAKNTILFTISSFGSKLLTFLLVPFYTSVLSTAEYGTVDLITTSSNLLTFIVTISIADAVLRFAIESIHSRYGVFRYGLNVILSGCSLFGLVLFVLSLLNPFNFDKQLYLFLYLFVLTNALYQLVSNYLRGIGQVLSVAIMGILVTAITIVSNLFFLLVLKMGIVGYLTSFVIGYSVPIVYGFCQVFKYDKDCLFQICNSETKRRMVRYSIPLILNGLAWWMNSSLDRYFVTYYCGIAINGLYAVASKIPNIISVINQVFSQAWGLSAIKEFNKEDEDGFFRNTYSLYSFVLIISCSALIIINKPLAKFLFSNDFYNAWKFSSILVISAVFSAMSGFLGSFFLAVKKSQIFAFSTLIAAVINTVLNILLIPHFGAIGAAVATGLSFFVIWLTRFLCVKMYLNLKVNLARELMAYTMLAFQATFEHLNGYNYIIQVLVFALLLLIYRTEFKKIADKTFSTLKRYLKKTNNNQ